MHLTRQHRGKLTDQSTTGNAGGPTFSAALVDLADLSHCEGWPENLASEFARLIKDALAVEYALIFECLQDPDMLLIQAAAGLGEDLAGRAAIGKDLGSQAGYTALANAPVVLEDAYAVGRPYAISPRLEAARVSSGVTVPISPGRPLYGVLGAFSQKPRRYSEAEVEFLSQAARYLSGVMLRHKEVITRKKSQRWLRVMEEATLRSVSATNRTTVLQSFAKLLSSTRDGVSDLCFIDLEHGADHNITREAAARNGALLSAAPDTKPLLYPPDPGCPHGTPAVLDTGQPHTITKVEREHLECLAHDEAHLEAFLNLGVASYMCLPIKRHRHTLGALVLISCDKHYTREDERHAGRLAYLIGMAIEAIQGRMERLSDAREKVDGYFGTPNKQQSFSPQTPLEAPQEALRNNHSQHPPTILLTDQRKTILHLLAEGKSPKQIAAQLTISPSTVYNTEHKLRNIFGATDRASLIRKAHKQGCLNDL